MAYRPNPQKQHEYDLNGTGVDDSAYEDRPLVYHEDSRIIHLLLSPLPPVPQMVPQGNHYRKDSFANSTGVLTPSSHFTNWEPKFASPHHMPDHVDTTTTHGFRADHQFAQHDSTHFFDNGACFPERDEPMSGPFHPGIPRSLEASPFPDIVSLGQHQSPHPFTPLQQEQNFGLGLQTRAPMSPHSQEDWETMGRLEREGLVFPSHMGVSSPAKQMERRRGDGVRKKNAKIDIPDGRTVPVIEEMLATTKDESKVKELKGQKRLLRNREAALASRQRKKKHTEDLEMKLAEVNREWQEMVLERNHYAQVCEIEKTQRVSLEQRLHQANVAITAMHQEKEHMIADHINLTINLRQRIHFLESINSPAPTMSAAPSSAGFTDLDSGMNHFNINGGDWDMKMLQPNHDWDAIAASEATIQPSKLLIDAGQPDAPITGEANQHISTGVLFMLLLCGAFVAANSGGSAPVIPRMPDEVREASNTILTNLLEELNTFPAMAMRPSSLDFSNELSGPLASWPSNGSANNAIATLHSRLTSPTKRQLAEQATMMTPEQCNFITQPTQYMDSPATNRPGRRNLADILANLRPDKIAKGSLADVYTRPLLWDQVPEYVVKQFKQAVQDSKNEQATSLSEDRSVSSGDFKE